MPPAKMPGFFDAAAKIAARHGATRASPHDELARARAPRVAGLAKAQLTNEYWLADLSGSIADPRRLDLIRTTFPDYAGGDHGRRPGGGAPMGWMDAPTRRGQGGGKRRPAGRSRTPRRGARARALP